MFTLLRPTQTRPRGVLCVLLAALMFLIGAATAFGATVTKAGLAAGIPGFPSQAGGLGVYEALTPVPPPDAVREVGAATVMVTADPAIPAEAPFAGTWRAYGVTDIRNHTDVGVAYPMELQLAADAWAGEFLADVPAKLTWLVRHADGLVASQPDPQRAAAAIQIVVWQTLRNPQGGLLPRADLVTPSDDPAVNALAVTFTALMEAGADAAGSALTLTAGAVIDCRTTVTITGPPRVPVTLQVDNAGVVSTPVVVLDGAGTGTVAVQGRGGDTVTVSAAHATGGVLVRADGAHDPDQHTTAANASRAPEELIFLAGATTTTASTPLACGGPPPPPPAAGSSPPPPAAPQAPGVTAVGSPSGTLELTKAAPPSLVAGQRMTYRLRVRNTGAVPVDAVVLRDAIPAGMTIGARPKGATLKSGVVTWRLGTLAPGAHRVVSLTVRVDRTVTGQRCNSASASAANAVTVRARACSQIRAVAGVSRIPIVTG